MFGAGYAGAADRLFLMDVLRHTGRAELASFLGGSNAGADAGQWSFAPYTEADLEKQVVQMPQLYGAAGPRRSADVADLCRRHQRLHRRRQAQPGAGARRVHAAGQTDGTVESHRRDRDRLAGRRHLRQGRRQRAQLGADHAGVRRTDGQGGRAQGLARLPRQERPRGADHDREEASPTRPAAPSPPRGLALPDKNTVRASRRPLRAPRRARAPATRKASVPGCRRRSSRRGTPRTGSSSRRRSPPPATRSP